MKENDIEELVRLRQTMVEILASGRALKREDVIKELQQPQWSERLYSFGKLSGLVYAASKLYSTDFYRVPISHEISLTFGMKEFLRRQAGSGTKESRHDRRSNCCRSDGEEGIDATRPDEIPTQQGNS